MAGTGKPRVSAGCQENPDLTTLPKVLCSALLTTHRRLPARTRKCPYKTTTAAAVVFPSGSLGWSASSVRRLQQRTQQRNQEHVPTHSSKATTAAVFPSKGVGWSARQFPRKRHIHLPEMLPSIIATADPLLRKTQCPPVFKKTPSHSFFPTRSRKNPSKATKNTYPSI